MSEELVTTQQALVVDAATSSANVSQSIAKVQAQYALAVRFPRDIDTVRLKLLKECRRPHFANVAIYHKPIGRGVEGPSIRFVEAAIRCMHNLAINVATIYDDERKRIVEVSVADLEANTCYSQEIAIQKTVERRDPKGATVISSRTNSTGQTVYTIPATDDDVLTRQNALISKAIRTQGLRLLPGDLLDEALNILKATRAQQDAKDPNTARKKLVDAFDTVGVMPADLVAYLGHSLAQTTPEELGQLRSIYTTIKDGEAKWSDYAKTEEPKEAKTSQTAEVLRKKQRVGNE